MKNTMNIAVVAFGRIAKTHILAAYMANLKMNLPFELKVTHIITSRPDAVCFHDIRTSRTLKEALEMDNDIDIIDICNINEAHYGEIQTAMQSHKAIICEKPLTDSLEKSKELSNRMKNTDMLHAVPLIFRYLPCIHLLKRELAKKEFGEIISFEGSYYHCSYLSEEKRNTWRTKKTSGGGASLDLGVHLMDCVRYIFGEPKHVDHTCQTHFHNIETDEVFTANLKMEGNVIGKISASRIYYQKKQKLEFEVFCEKGSYLCDLTSPYQLIANKFEGNTTILKPRKTDTFMKYMVSEQEATSFHLDAHMNFIANFAKHVYDPNEEFLYADFEQAYLAQSLLE